VESRPAVEDDQRQDVGQNAPGKAVVDPLAVSLQFTDYHLREAWRLRDGRGFCSVRVSVTRISKKCGCFTKFGNLEKWFAICTENFRVDFGMVPSVNIFTPLAKTKKMYPAVLIKLPVDLVLMG